MLVVVKVSTGEIHPAENISWTQADVASPNGYAIHTIAAAFSGVTIPAEVTTSGQPNDIVLATLGKSGRYVPLTDQFVNP